MCHPSSSWVPCWLTLHTTLWSKKSPKWLLNGLFLSSFAFACRLHTIRTYKPKTITKANQNKPTKPIASPCAKHKQNQKTWVYTSISSNTLFTYLFVTFFPTYSFNILVEAFADVASPYLCWIFNLLLQLQCISWLLIALCCCCWVDEL